MIYGGGDGGGDYRDGGGDHRDGGDDRDGGEDRDGGDSGNWGVDDEEWKMMFSSVNQGEVTTCYFL
ncbi:hypothetical protein HanRHA438_Chr15g0711661 [Helianthus annuus]|nr:hypothetical protein HanRHA438_Chr15g0711661 [Helianthus annuus]